MRFILGAWEGAEGTWKVCRMRSDWLWWGPLANEIQGGAWEVCRRCTGGAQKVHRRCNANDLIGCGGDP